MLCYVFREKRVVGMKKYEHLPLLNNNDTVVEPLNSIDHSITRLSRQSSTLLVSLGAALPYYNHRLYSHTNQLYSLSLSRSIYLTPSARRTPASSGSSSSSLTARHGTAPAPL